MDTDFIDALGEPDDDEFTDEPGDQIYDEMSMNPPSLTINGAEPLPDVADERPEVWADDVLYDPSESDERTVEEVEPMPADPADVARSLSTLSPKAAQALAAVADSESADDDSDEAGAIEERSRMLRFLGSV
jgi:hypothetical protein